LDLERFIGEERKQARDISVKYNKKPPEWGKGCGIYPEKSQVGIITTCSAGKRPPTWPTPSHVAKGPVLIQGVDRERRYELDRAFLQSRAKDPQTKERRVVESCGATHPYWLGEKGPSRSHQSTRTTEGRRSPECTKTIDIHVGAPIQSSHEKKPELDEDRERKGCSSSIAAEKIRGRSSEGGDTSMPYQGGVTALRTASPERGKLAALSRPITGDNVDPIRTR